MKRFPIAAFALTAALSFVPALADETSVTVSGFAPTSTGGLQLKAVVVSYGDLDIASAPGAAVLLGRIENASRLVCGERSGLAMIGERARDFAACRAGATAKAVRTVGAPALTQAAASR
jgi:UrcA family protein